MARRSSYRRSASETAAKRHIEAARALSLELGGADRDVKDWLFALPARELAPIFDDYEVRHGAVAREYAENTLPRWRSGRVTMSGQTAERLFALLPPRMPLEEKYKLTESLWRHVGPSSRKVLRIGTDADIEAVADAVQAHVESAVVAYVIPDELERRFQWLSGGDVAVKQQLLNHIRQAERSLAVEAVRLQVPVMLAHARAPESVYTRYMGQHLRIGKHELEVTIDRSAVGVRIEDPVSKPWAAASSRGHEYRGPNSKASSPVRLLLWLAAAAIGTYFVVQAV